MSLSVAEFETIVETDHIPAEPDTYVDSDGWIITRDGEVVGKVEIAEAFEVDSREKADFVLAILSKIEGDIAGVAARRAALNAMLNSLAVEHRKRWSWWHWKFESSLKRFSRTLLTEKMRTAKFGWGQVAYRKTAGSTSIINDEAALAFVKTWAPKLVQSKEWVTVTAVKTALEIAKKACPDDVIDTPFLATSGETESVTISTGIKLEKGNQ